MAPNSEKYQTLKPFFKTDSKWFIKNVMSLVTMEREFLALHRMRKCHFYETLLNPAATLPKQNITSYFSIPKELDSVLHKKFNPSQFEAIQACLKKSGATLIQGPPGTGKTSTIIGLLSVLFSSQDVQSLQREKSSVESGNEATRNKGNPANDTQEQLEKNKQFYAKAQPWLRKEEFRNWRDSPNPGIKALLDRNGYFPKSTVESGEVIEMPPRALISSIKPSKILICAPSNAAIDEIIRKMLAEGIYDEMGKPYVPNLVRIGPNYHPDLKNYSLEYLAGEEENMAGNKMGSGPGKQGGKSEKDEARNSVLKKANIICSTLSVAGASFMGGLGEDFDTVIIDEAAQAVEISTLIPLQYSTDLFSLLN